MKCAIRWFNPRTGEWVTDEKSPGSFAPPNAEDRGLVVIP